VRSCFRLVPRLRQSVLLLRLKQSQTLGDVTPMHYVAVRCDSILGLHVDNIMALAETTVAAVQLQAV
jgi:hypothetical protein